MILKLCVSLSQVRILLPDCWKNLSLVSTKVQSITYANNCYEILAVEPWGTFFKSQKMLFLSVSWGGTIVCMQLVADESSQQRWVKKRKLERGGRGHRIPRWCFSWCYASPATQWQCCTDRSWEPLQYLTNNTVFDLTVFVCGRSNLLETPFTIFFACAASSCGRARSGWAQNFYSIHPHIRSAFFLLCRFFNFKCVKVFAI